MTKHTLQQSHGPAYTRIYAVGAARGENAVPNDDLVGPIKMPNGYYLFKVDSIQTRKYEEVKDQIYEELRQERFQNWFNQQRAAFKVVIDDLDGFRQTVSFAR